MRYLFVFLVKNFRITWKSRHSLLLLVVDSSILVVDILQITNDEVFMYDPLTITSNKETFLQDFLKIQDIQNL